MTPVVSVLLPVHNGMPWLPDALDSLAAQTLPGVEVIVIDDGSTDGTNALLQHHRLNPRVVLNTRRQGLTRSLNRGLARVSAPLVARLDADDTSRPDRLARQVAFLAAHPEVGLLGTGAIEMAGQRVVRLVTPPVDDASLRAELIRRNPFVHSSVMFRRDLVRQVGGYDERIAVAQDYDLWMRMAPVTKLACLPDPLVTRRLLPTGITATKERARRWTEARVRMRAVAQGQYPAREIVHALRPLAALACPRSLREAIRGARGPRLIEEKA